MDKKGLFIAIEGGDGSGKGTQAELLRKHYAETLGYHVLKVSFPRYEEKSAYYAAQYLNGAYGKANDVHPDLASLAYALDRFAAANDILTELNYSLEPIDKKQDIEQARKIGGMVIADRYVASNLAHQGTKFASKAKRQEFYKRMLDTEYNILGIPKPDQNIVLLVPADISQINVDKKDRRSYTNKKRDIHEADKDHLEKAKANYEELCELYPEEFTPINCINEKGELRSIDDIQTEIRNIVKSRI